MPKKKWTTPQLIVLVRGKPEERVLCVCKADFAASPDVGPGSFIASNCLVFISLEPYNCGCCCSGVSPS